MTHVQPAGRIGITGGSGFVGSSVTDRMIAAGHDVVILDMRPPQRTDVAYRHVDVLDLGTVVQATRDLDTVFHLAVNRQPSGDGGRREAAGRTVGLRLPRRAA
jgi:nucleoside-diphosphate-sugar epimerase